MLNAEKWRKELDELLENGYQIAIKDGKPRTCGDTPCCECDLNQDGQLCSAKKLARWLISEYQEQKVDWNKVAVDTPILTSIDGEEWDKRHFARYENGEVYAWVDGNTSWSAENNEVTAWGYAKLAEDGGLDA